MQSRHGFTAGRRVRGLVRGTIAPKFLTSEIWQRGGFLRLVAILACTTCATSLTTKTAAACMCADLPLNLACLTNTEVSIIRDMAQFRYLPGGNPYFVARPQEALDLLLKPRSAQPIPLL